MLYTELKEFIWSSLLMGEDEIDEVVALTFEEISKIIAEGETVRIPGFGEFHLSRYAARVIPRAFGEEETFYVEARTIVRFRPYGALVDWINKE